MVGFLLHNRSADVRNAQTAKNKYLVALKLCLCVCNPAQFGAGPKPGEKEEGWRQEGHPAINEVAPKPQHA